MDIGVVGVVAKDVFQVHAADQRGRLVCKKRLSRSKLIEFMSNLKPCLVAMEACIGSHYWARTFEAMGHSVRILAPQFVKPFVKSNKNDATDAEAIVEAVLRPTMRFVSVKQAWQQDIQHIHRVRERLVRSRTSLSNEIRSFLLEYGITVPKSLANLRRSLPIFLGGHPDLSSLAIDLFRELYEKLCKLQEQIKRTETMIEAFYKSSEKAKRLTKIEGIGPITATAMVGSVGNFKNFKMVGSFQRGWA